MWHPTIERAAASPVSLSVTSEFNFEQAAVGVDDRLTIERAASSPVISSVTNQFRWVSPSTTFHLPPSTFHLPPYTAIDPAPALDPASAYLQSVAVEVSFHHLPPTSFHLPLSTYHLPPSTFHLPSHPSSALAGSFNTPLSFSRPSTAPLSFSLQYSRHTLSLHSTPVTHSLSLTHKHNYTHCCHNTVPCLSLYCSCMPLILSFLFSALRSGCLYFLYCQFK